MTLGSATLGSGEESVGAGGMLHVSVPTMIFQMFARDSNSGKQMQIA
eukprot:CAMPEP_0119110330 /NCGR_PEP_ID=MMETSP1180-20130426/28753_1 /TAXON_ID=3052 ORGANISM="Chlamydomonas cf sp, Strain CCMP681" /NCGR_SAMPLE_ID=MMETSP1180 /ASSEMBLY_ACC=CAM_ASM_000741 /LENGTH=46 /DNA_ID= /DNA_START= /DNA_END= /DNA_ORIENTATION=